MGFASIIIGIFSVTFSLVPFLNYTIVVPALLGVVLGGIAILISKQQTKNRGIAVAGASLNGLALIIVLIWTISITNKLSNFKKMFSFEGLKHNFQKEEDDDIFDKIKKKFIPEKKENFEFFNKKRHSQKEKPDGFQFNNENDSPHSPKFQWHFKREFFSNEKDAHGKPKHFVEEDNGDSIEEFHKKMQKRMENLFNRDPNSMESQRKSKNIKPSNPLRENEEPNKFEKKYNEVI